jgi:hypothetical protein
MEKCGIASGDKLHIRSAAYDSDFKESWSGDGATPGKGLVFRRAKRNGMRNAGYSKSFTYIWRYRRTGRRVDRKRFCPVPASAAACLRRSSASATLRLLSATAGLLPAATAAAAAAAALWLLPAVSTMAYGERLPAALHGAGRSLQTIPRLLRRGVRSGMLMQLVS